VSAAVFVDIVDSSTSASDVIAAVRHYEWAWLVQLVRRLNTDVVLVDGHGVPVVSAVSDALAPTVRQPEFSALVARARHASAAETIRTGGALVACAAVRSADEPWVLAVLRAAPAGASATESGPAALPVIAPWLASAVEAHLESERRNIDEQALRLSALRRALAEAETSEVDVVKVFADAAAIWEDVEVRGYIERADGQYELATSPRGGATEGFPSQLPPGAAVPRELSRISARGVDQLGIGSNADMFVARIAPPSASSWLLSFSGAADGGTVNRLSVYVDALEQVLREVGTEQRWRLQRALWHHLLGDADDLASAATGTVGEIKAAIDADASRLTIALGRGGQVVGAGDAVDAVDRRANASRSLRTTRDLPGGGSLTIAAARHAGREAFTARDRDLLQTACELLQPWAAGAGRTAWLSERRAALRPFDAVVQQMTSDAARRGSRIAVLVIRLRDDAVLPGTAGRLAARIRPYLRAAEPAGAVTDREIATVLFDATAQQAEAVVERLRRLGHAQDDERAGLATAAFGVAHAEPGGEPDIPLLTAARNDARLTEQGNEISSDRRS
jgi:hypothetical protein